MLLKCLWITWPAKTCILLFGMKNLKRLQDIEKLDSDVKEKLYFVIGIIIQKLQQKRSFKFEKPF